ncbi:MAG: Hsp20/alpha crystallin family protein [Magnetococcales bacterium]|nr:Hsp20/alpha crystallin family protein [Magnetococcales bacterium]NGZ25860.1 Hsp20/alpha crystallin family protein [Magnetococcales bacterium]
MSMLVNYDSFRNFRTLQNEINRLFDRDIEESNGQISQWGMRVDIHEDKNQIVLQADLPGMELKDIHVNLENSLLTISGERKFSNEVKKENYHRVERAYGHFSRSFQLPPSADQGNINASYNNGVLQVTIGKREEAKPRAIEVKIN